MYLWFRLVGMTRGDGKNHRDKLRPMRPVLCVLLHVDVNAATGRETTSYSSLRGESKPPGLPCFG